MSFGGKEVVLSILSSLFCNEATLFLSSATCFWQLEPVNSVHAIFQPHNSPTRIAAPAAVTNDATTVGGTRLSNDSFSDNMAEETRSSHSFVGITRNSSSDGSCHRNDGKSCCPSTARTNGDAKTCIGKQTFQWPWLHAFLRLWSTNNKCENGERRNGNQK